MHVCGKEREWAESEALDTRVVRHLDEADRDGGTRDQLRDCVSFVRTFCASLRYAVFGVVLIAFLAGVIGGMLGRLSPRLGDAVADAVFSVGE